MNKAILKARKYYSDKGVDVSSFNDDEIILMLLKTITLLTDAWTEFADLLIKTGNNIEKACSAFDPRNVN